MVWEYKTLDPDGQYKLFGVNTSDYDRESTGRRIEVKDPIYRQDRIFEVWQVETDGQLYHSTAGEFSNCV